MNLPNIWGQGALFAFSALDGTCTPKSSLVGNLLGDKLGIGFMNPEKFEIYFTFSDLVSLDFELVASDIIKASVLDEDNVQNPLDIVFVTQNALLMRYPKSAELHIKFENSVKEYKNDSLRVFTIGKESVTLLSRDVPDYTYSVLCFGKHSEREASEIIRFDINEEISKKLAFFEALPIVSLENPDTERLLYKCFSVMKASYMSGGGMYTGVWSSTSRTDLDNRDYADWALSLIAGKYFDGEKAEQSLRTIIDLEEESGRILKNDTYGRTKSSLHYPVIAWMTYELYLQTKNVDFVASVYDKLKKYMQWLMDNKDYNHLFLYSWNADSNGNFININECDMPESPRLEDNSPIEALDFTSFIANEVRAMANIAKILDRQGEYLYWDVIFDRIKKSITYHLYDAEDNFYYDRFTSGNAYKKIKTIVGFMPIFASVCEQSELKTLMSYIFDEDALFISNAGIPSLSKKDKRYENDMWYGAMFPIYNYFIIKGLNDAGAKKQAEYLKSTVLSAVTKWYKNDGVLYECYDADNALTPSRMPKNRCRIFPETFDTKGRIIRDDFHTACAVIALIMSEIK